MKKIIKYVCILILTLTMGFHGITTASFASNNVCNNIPYDKIQDKTLVKKLDKQLKSSNSYNQALNLLKSDLKLGKQSYELFKVDDNSYIFTYILNSNIDKNKYFQLNFYLNSFDDTFNYDLKTFTIKEDNSLGLLWIFDDTNILNITVNVNGEIMENGKIYNNVDDYINSKNKPNTYSVCSKAMSVLCGTGGGLACYGICGISAIVSRLGAVGCAAACAAITSLGCSAATDKICG